MMNFIGQKELDFLKVKCKSLTLYPLKNPSILEGDVSTWAQVIVADVPVTESGLT